MSEQGSDRLGPPGDEPSRWAWLANAPEGTSDDDVEDPLVRRVELRQHDYAGPFWSDEGHLSDDFDELHRWIGISRELFDDATAWNDEPASLESRPTEDWRRRHFARQQDLLRRLGREVRPGIEVDAPRAEPPTVVPLSRLTVDAEAGHLVLWDAEATSTGRARVLLPPTPRALTRRVLAWVADAGRHAHATAGTEAAVFAWEDEGCAVARELQEVVGDDYRVVAR